MAALLLPDIDPVLHDELRRRADDHHRSVAEEVLETLRLAVAGPDSPVRDRDVLQPGQPGTALIALAREIFGPEGLELDLPPRRGQLERPPPDFSGPEYDP